MLQELFELKADPGVAERVVFLDDYDLATAALLVRGLRRLGQPAAAAARGERHERHEVGVNGGLQLSVLDGWWAEAYDGHNGWALRATSIPTPPPRTPAMAPSCSGCSPRRCVPLFYERDDGGLPQRWLERVRASLCSLAPRFNAQRMLRDYRERIYGD